MTNPWLDIPLAEYEQHMALPYVGQADLLADALAEAFAQHRPSSIAIAGCAGGNGFERVIGTSVERVVGIDINPTYLQSAQQRYGDRIAGLELLVGDIESTQFGFEPVDLVFAGLLFEYVHTQRALENIRSMLLPGGVLTTVLQLPSHVGTVTPSPYRSLEKLVPIMRLIPPDTLARAGDALGFTVLSSRAMTAKGGKQFAVQDFRAPGIRA